MENPSQVSSTNVPAKTWLEQEKQDISRTIIPFVGTLSIIERAKIANWFEANISKDKKTRRKWLGLLPIAHAHTVFIASRLKAEPKSQGLDEHARLQKAWNAQFTGVLPLWTDVDVDRDCLYRLEERMFERSGLAGIAGNCQWGLDAGDHQGDWDPYAGIPMHWNHEDREGSERELEVRLKL